MLVNLSLIWTWFAPRCSQFSSSFVLGNFAFLNRLCLRTYFRTVVQHFSVALSHPEMLLILWYKAIDLLWPSVIAWSDRRGPNSLGITIYDCIIAKQHCIDGRELNAASLKFVKINSLGNSLGNFQLEVFDWESKSSSLSWSSWIHISFFQQLLFESISSVVWQIVSISGEKLKAKGKTKLLANYLKIFTWGYLRVAHKETHTVSNILVTASQFFKLSKLIGMCNINFSVGKIWISKEVSLWSDV